MECIQTVTAKQKLVAAVLFQYMLFSSLLDKKCCRKTRQSSPQLLKRIFFIKRYNNKQNLVKM